MPVDGPDLTASGGLLLSLLTESFAVRALVGCVAASGLAAVAVHLDLVRSRKARRLVVIAPVVSAAAAAVASVASVDDAYLPQLWVATSATTAAAGSLLQLFGQSFGLDRDRGVDLLVLGYALVVAVLLSRRVVGALAVRRLLHAARPLGDPAIVARFGALAEGFGMVAPRLLLLDGCPGGAFTTGGRRGRVAVDPVLVERLDDAELDGLLAHELAHVARRDTVVSALVGLVRDLAFFVPPVHLASRWLHHEQEESADELASAVTHRPVALASSILKVWDRARERTGDDGPERLGVVCAAVPVRGRLAFAGAGATTPTSPAVRAITVRVERLIAETPALTMWQRGVEALVAAAVLVTATSAVIVVPGYIATELDTTALSVGYLTPPPAQAAVEAPAFATFRALAPEVHADDLRPSGQRAAALEGNPGDPRGCPCVESQAQLRQGVAAGPPSPAAGLQWRSSSREPWQVTDARGDRVVEARPLWTLNDEGPQVGVYLVGSGGR